MSYFEIESPVESCVEIKKSKFYTHLVPYSDFSNELTKMKERYVKANHFVYAYRYLNEFDQVVENQSDDGEPKGSSGKPTLSVLAGKQLINTAAITARIFGGTKLGVGGLVRAYGESVKQSIAIAQLVEFKKLVCFNIECNYSAHAKLKSILKLHSANITNSDFNAEHVLLSVSIQEDGAPILKQELQEFAHGSVKVFK